ncbi:MULTISPECIES: hypothetical protein [unclassified Mycobacterium]|uniref:hypothetical protein n=1 Tax=unclassified Mycobacterium TaxID=2642494 RepID=UPI0007FE6005|nr:MULTISPECIES: hypothetical protein [unclassified Mycobacterium]OBH06988.1 hypothetical protein A9X04_24370 [Mycobacterium sp. E3247]OBI11029.1 hypothetical protein A5713_06855 [Mycobacterium sp. E2497]
MGLFRKNTHPAQAAGEAKVYYSTPFGNTKDGNQKLFLLGRGEMQFFPVFRSKESLIAFYEKMNRAAYMILEGDVQRVLETTRSIELMKDVGIVIEPFGANPVEIMPNS